MRGTSPNRSEKITLMEDGVLISPAPYSAPAAYYFPTVSRMQSFEILKGGSQIQYGPYTGGAINMVSTKFQDVFQAVLLPA
jgi:Fe(3+) dicitrate transport protein